MLAVLLGREVVVNQILRPVLVLGVAVGRAHAHDLLGHGVLGEVGAVDSCSNTAGQLVARGVLGLRHKAGARHRRDGKQHRQHADDHQDDLDGLRHVRLALLLARAGGSAGLLLGRRRDLGVLFLICHSWLSHNESNKRHCVTTQPPRHAWCIGDRLICTILVQRGQMWQPAVRDSPQVPAQPYLRSDGGWRRPCLERGLAEHVGCGIGVHKDVHERLQGLDLAARLGDARLMTICAGTGAPMPAIALNVTGAAGFTTAI